MPVSYYASLLGAHLLVVLAAVHLHRGGFYGEASCRTFQRGDSNCSSFTLVDVIPDTLLHVELGLATRLLAVIVMALYSLLIAYMLYRVCFARIDYAANMMDNLDEQQLGHVITPGRTRRDVANRMRQMRKSGKTPPIYPNGWYEVIRSDELPVGGVKAVSMIGQQLAVFRGESGEVSVMDAYCPHLGAHLGVGGVVRGDCIECPFHGWQYDGETGQCTKIPYASKVPNFAKVKVWPSMERNGYVFLWFDAEGRDPSYFIEEKEKVKRGQWVYKGRVTHYIPCHIEEIPENAGDVIHLNHLHHHGITSGWGVNYMKGWLAKVVEHEADAIWKPLPPPDAHTSRLSMTLTTKLLGFKLFAATLTADQIGPAVVHLNMSFFFGNVLIVQTVVPEKPLLQRMTNSLYADWWLPSFVGYWILRAEGIQVNRDVMVWTNKTYIPNPLLVKEDHLIVNHRRWYSQFYSENSPRLKPSRNEEEEDLSW